MSQDDALTWPTIYTDLIAGRDLEQAAVEWAMAQIMDGAATPAQIAGFLVGLRAKGESVEEMHGLAEVMLSRAHRIEVEGPSLDIVGTGGDRAHTVNISTMSSIVAAAAGVRVVKHGNRAASSSSGSADVLEALGIDLSLAPERVVEVVRQAGITFCFAQTFHPSFRHTAVPRRELGVGSAFNFLGPLTNPAQPTYAVVGCADARMAPLLAGVFASRGTKLSELDVGDFEHSMQVNAIGPIRVTQALLPNLRAGKGRKIVGITSTLGSITNNTDGGFYGYRESKAALNMFMRTLAAELRSEGFICIPLHPGWVQTDMGGPSAHLTPKESVTGMRKVIENLKPADSGKFWEYDGSNLPW